MSDTTALFDTRLMQKATGELIGTFALVFAGCGAIMVDHTSGGRLGHLGVALTFGLVIAVMVSALGHISGAHFNPAVTIAFAAVGRFPWKQVPAYIAAQLIAAVMAAATLSSVLGSVASVGATSTTLATPQTLVVEGIATFFLMFVIISVATDSRAVGSMAAPAIGGTVALGALFAGPLTGASMNPARSFGPALLAGDFSQLWLYIVGPLLGAAAGAFVYTKIQCSDEEASEARGCC